MTILGIDVSAYQAGIDMSAVAAEGFDFALIKVSEGSAYRSPAYPAQRDGAERAGLVWAAYHFVTTDNPTAQATNCRAALGDPSVPVALDWENGGGDWRTFVAVLNAFRAAGLRPVLAYCPHWYWMAHGSPDVAATGLPLWSSHYPTTALGAAVAQFQAVQDADWGGYGGARVALLQFSDSATGVAGHTVDCSAFRGTRDQLAALLANPSAVPADPTPTSSAAPVIPRTGEDNPMFITTPTPAPGTPKASWPTQRVSFGFDPAGGWGGRCAIKLHWGEPGGFVHAATWWLRPSGGGVGIPNARHTPVGISLNGQAERFVGLGWEIVPPEFADELDLIIAAPGGVHIFPVYEH